MNWEQMLMAMKALSSDVVLGMREPSNWYVQAHGIELREPAESGMLTSITVAEPSPERAVQAYWKRLTNPTSLIVRGAYSPDRRHLRWNGYMWEDASRQFPLPRINPA